MINKSNGSFQLLVKSYNERLFVTGLVYIKRGTKTVHEHYNLVDEPLNRLSPDRLRPTTAMLESVNRRHGLEPKSQTNNRTARKPVPKSLKSMKYQPFTV